MRVIDQWTGGASAYRQFVYRITEDSRGMTVLEVKESAEEDSAFKVVEHGHRIARILMELLLEDRKVIQLRARQAR